MDLKAIKETDTGLNTEFINTKTNRTISLDHAIEQIDKGNPNYDNYQTVQRGDTTYIRSKPNNSTTDNIE